MPKHDTLDSLRREVDALSSRVQGLEDLALMIVEAGRDATEGCVSDPEHDGVVLRYLTPERLL